MEEVGNPVHTFFTGETASMIIVSAVAGLADVTLVLGRPGSIWV